MERSTGGMAGPFVALTNQVAAAVAARYPHMQVDTLAYTFTADSPNASAPAPVVLGKNAIAR